MSSNQSTVDFIIAQMSGAGDVSFKKMFGEYGIDFIGNKDLVITSTAFFCDQHEGCANYKQ